MRRSRADGEATSRTDGNGQFVLTGTGSAVVADVGTDAREFDPVRNVETPVPARFVLRAPKEAPGIVSFESTSVMAEMETSALSFENAVQKVAIADGVNAKKLLTDFNKEADATVRVSLQAASDEASSGSRAAWRRPRRRPTSGRWSQPRR